MITSLQDILVVVDMDNTLLTAEKGIPLRNIEAVRKFTGLGGRFTIASGRTSESVGRYLHQIQLSAPAITYNGGVIYDFENQHRITSTVLPKAAAAAALTAIQKKFPGIGIEIMADNGYIYVIQANQYTYLHTVHEKLTYIVTQAQDVPGEWNKVLFACDHNTLLQIQAFSKKLHSPNMYFIATNTIYFEIIPKGVGKGAALHSLCQYLQMPIENTVAIGDYYNDVDIMREAGYSVAMGNAPDDVKAQADTVTGNCLDGGVADVLEELIRKYS